MTSPAAAAPAPVARGRTATLKALTFLMFAMFAMTTDSVGVIIPQIIRQFSLAMTAAGAFQYATMGGISLAALGLGFLADRLGRKPAIILGLLLFAGSSAAFAVGRTFPVFVMLLFVGGLGIGVFKAGALALIGDLSRSTREHTATMNTVEGFFGVGAIVGSAIVAALVHRGLGWQWLYVIAATVCALLIMVAALVPYPPRASSAAEVTGPRELAAVLKDPHAWAFSVAAMLYVGVETGVYVWAPTYLAGYHGPLAWAGAYAVSAFFTFRAVARFAGPGVLARYGWTRVLAVATVATAACFLAAVVGGRAVAMATLPLSGAFMSVIYPTLNSKGISCFEKAKHGAASGVLLFFTCLAAVGLPLAMGALSDAFGDASYSIALAAGLASLLAALAVFNLIKDPMAARLSLRDEADYGAELV